MNILLIGGVYSEHLIPEFTINCKSGFQFAAQALQESIIKGLLQNGISLFVLSFPSVPTYPISYNKPYLRSDGFYFASRKIGETIGRINIPIFKHELGYKKKIDRWFRKNEGKKYVLIYSLQAKFLDIAKYIKRNYNDTEICVVVADLPEYMSWNKYYERLGLKKRDIAKIYKNLKFVDKYILLSKYMIDKLPNDNKKWTVVEGIFNPTIEGLIPPIEKDKCKAILYTGNIDKRYGIMDAVYAFRKIKDNNIFLWICGFGNSESEIRELENKDSRIKYFGSIPRKEVLRLQRRACLLINPRHSDEEFTKYSFPSKTMEYLASGTPTLMCKLQCIPADYEPYLFFIKDESIDGYKEAMLDVLSRSDSELKEFGINARHFILDSKTPQIQARKIITFMKGE